MAVPIDVTPVNETRDNLHQILERFRSEGPGALPVVFGPQRKREAAIIPIAMFDFLVEKLEEEGFGENIRQIANERLAAGLTPIGKPMESVEEIQAYFEEIRSQSTAPA